MGVTKTLTIEELEEHLQETLAEVREGTIIEVVDDGKKVATIKPVPKPFDLTDPGPGRRPFDFAPTPLSKPLDKDPAEVIIEERERERSGLKYR